MLIIFPEKKYKKRSPVMHDVSSSWTSDGVESVC